jgi:hypothetical protein
MGTFAPEVDQSGGENHSGHAMHAVKRDDGQHTGMECMARPFDRFDTGGPREISLKVT